MKTSAIKKMVIRTLCAAGLAGVMMSGLVVPTADAAQRVPTYPNGICRWLPWMCK